MKEKEFVFRFRRIWIAASRRFGNHPLSNYAFGAAHFVQRLRRPPLSPMHRRSEIADVLFDRMVHDRWDALHRACTDKVTAKEWALRLAPQVLAARTEAVIDVDSSWSVADVERALRPYAGQSLVAKPAHSCGGFVDLSRPLTSAALSALHERAVTDYSPVFRETQYYRLPKRIIVEERLGDGLAVAPDYKFHCTWGWPVTVQIDHARHSEGRRAMMQIDGWRWFDGGMGGRPFDVAPERPSTWDRMLAIVDSLCAPFDFVRIDLYEHAGQVYFGEFTFTPSACTVITSSRAVRACLNTAYRAGPIAAHAYAAASRRLIRR